MTEYSIEEIKDKWLNMTDPKGRSFHIYIDSPFCFKQCKYCIYTPIVTKIGSDVYNKYYKEVLPEEINKFKEVMEKYDFTSVYFGGGTSSYMSTEVMLDVFNSIPKFKEIPFKLFEAHPIFLSKNKIDILADYGFTNVSIGVQSFNKELIEGQNRVYSTPEKIKEIVDYIKLKGMQVNCDLLTFMTQNPPEDLKILEQDLETMAWVNPSLVDLYPMHGTYGINGYPTEVIYKFRKIIAKFLLKHKQWSPLYKLTMDREDIEKLTISNYKITTLTEEEMNKMSPYSSSGGNHRPDSQNVLALGCSTVRSTYSYFGHKFYYMNVMGENDKITYVERGDR